ncbi:PREDICTED: glutathione S-transferase F4-like [Tarenaya hassleriana]|uniref:glutathione S-transferase F4-like n=1 Tax=Tarenaya hassleriana TaxID=28532 RepID=UPI00053C8208|nr:PREDICTED: glutathione S-transferase F4-like [Tarenaya hassleriana]
MLFRAMQNYFKMVFEVFNWKGLLAKKDFGYKVHGHPLSTNTRRVLAALYEKGLGYEAIEVDLKSGQHKKDPFLRHLNPFGQIPVFEDGSLKLIESRAITQYIAYVHSSRGNPLLNLESHKTMAIQTMWMEIEAQQFSPPASALTWEQVIKPIYNLPTDQSAVEENEAKLSKVLDVYEKRLAETGYDHLASESFTLADLHHLPNIELLYATKTRRLFEERPRVTLWVARIRARPAWQSACDVACWSSNIKQEGLN